MECLQESYQVHSPTVVESERQAMFYFPALGTTDEPILDIISGTATASSRCVDVLASGYCWRQRNGAYHGPHGP